MNTFLNENWSEMVRELEKPIDEGAGQIGKRIFTNIFELVPFDEIFPEAV
jgi:hypothetical protein